MKTKLLFLTLVAAAFGGSLFAQDFNSSYNFVAKGSQGPGTSFANTNVTAFAISWNTSPPITSCAVQVDSSSDGVTWGSGDLIASQNCAVVGSVSATSLATGKNFVRITVTTLNGTGGLNVNLKGYAGGSSSSASSAPNMGFYLTNNCLPGQLNCVSTSANTQQTNFCSWTAATPSTVACTSRITVASASVTNNVATYTANTTSIPQTFPSNWAAGDSITVVGFTSGDTIFNITCTLTAASTSSISCPLVHANGTSGSFGTITNTSAGPFVAGDVGKQVAGWGSCIADAVTLGTNAITVGGAPLITSFISKASVQITTAANAQAAQTGCFIYGTPDDAAAVALEALYDASNVCPKVFLAAANYMFTAPHFNTVPAACDNEGVNFLSTGVGNVYYPASFELEGRGTGNTIIFLMPNFGPCSTNTSPQNPTLGTSNGCFVVPYMGHWRDFQINGGSNGSPSVTNSILVSAMIASLDNITITNWGNTANSSADHCLTVGYQTQLYQVNLTCGDIGLQVLNAQGVVTGVKVYSENSGFRALSVEGPPGSGGATLGYSFICTYCGFYSLQNNTSGMNLISNQGGSIYLRDTQIGPFASNGASNPSFGYRCQTTAGCVLRLENSFIKLNALTTDTDIICIVACTNYLLNDTLTSGATGNTYIDAAGSFLYDEGGNSFAGGTASVSGSIIGDASITGTTITAAKLVLSAGWGTTAAWTALTGNTRLVQGTITASGTGQAANPTIVYTFPTPFLGTSNLICSATQVAGTQAAVANPFVPSSLTAAGVTFTYQGTPVAANTFVVQISCGVK